MLIRWLPLIAGVVPFVGVTASYIVAVRHDLLPYCLPYVVGCTSISATGRYEPASYLFDAVELPTAVVLIGVWYFSVRWLRALLPAASRRMATTIMICGCAGALALIVYVTFLGTTSPLYEFMRRFGIYFYFLGTVLAQLFVTLSLRRYCRLSGNVTVARLARTMIWLAIAPFALGVLNLLLKAVLEDSNEFENRIEWIAALIMQAWFVVLFFAWRRTGFNVSVSVRNAN